MSSLSVAVVPGGSSADTDRLEDQVRAQLARFVAPARDGEGFWRSAVAALGQAWHATTPEDLARGSAVAARGPWRLVADARVDNREELIGALGLERSTGDPEILLAGWERWGTQVIARVVGDYAFAAWNDDTHALYLGRDALGTRPLYFSYQNAVVVVASELHALGVGPYRVAFELEPDEAARFMVDRHSAVAATLFRRVEVVGPGEVVTFDGRTPRGRRERVWRPDPFAQAPEGDFATHRERLREVMSQSIVARMRAVDPPSILLSGGVDSTVMTCLAARLVPSTTPRRMLHLTQRGYPRDETDHFERVVEAVGGRAVLVDPRSYVDRLGPDSDLVPPGELYDITLTMMGPLFSSLSDSGRSVLLSGVGSDDILQESGNECFTHLAAGRWRAALSSGWRAGEDRGGRFGYLTRQLLRFVLPAPAWHLARDMRPSRWVWPDWLTEPARRRLDEWHRREVRATESVPAPDPIQRGIALMFRGAFDLHLLLARADYQSRAMGVDQRMPYYDRRVVELLLALPHELRFDGERAKPILRAVGEGIAPAENLLRGGGSDFSPFIEAARLGPHRSAWETRLRAPEVEGIGVVRPGALQSLFRTCPDHRALTRAMAIEVACRTLKAPSQPTGEELRRRARACLDVRRQEACGASNDKAR